MFAYILLRAAHDYKRDFATPHKEIVTRVSRDMGTHPVTAAWVVRDITIGRDYAFLMVCCTTWTRFTLGRF